MGFFPCFRWWVRGKKKKDNKNKAQSNNHGTEPRQETAPIKNLLPSPRERNNTPNGSPTFTYADLARATNDFSPDCYLGRGGFGAVYKGKLASTGQVVAVKQLDPSGFQGEKEFLVEVLMLTLVHHPHLVNLIGFCAEEEQRLLVYEFMPMGSLEDLLFNLTPDMVPLDWNTRIRIASGAAKGLACLHSANPPVIYRDLKASNILLDEHFAPKLSDFGLAKFGPIGDKSHVSTRVMGTYGYCAPEYALTGRLTLKTDIYSYGVVLLELITGRPAVEEIDGKQMHLTKWALPLMKDPSNYPKLVDPLLKGQYSLSVLKKAVEVAAMCLSENASSRPSSKDLALAMEYLEARNARQVRSQDGYHSPTETTAMLEKEERDAAVAEAKMWGESYREKQQQMSPQNNPRYQP